MVGEVTTELDNLDNVGDNLSRIYSLLKKTYAQTKGEVSDYDIPDVSRLSDSDLNNLFRQDFLIQKLVSRYPKKSKALGYYVQDEKGKTINENDEFILDAFTDASICGRLYGKAYLILGKDVTSPLRKGEVFDEFQILYNLKLKGDFYFKDEDTRFHKSRVYVFIGYKTYHKDVTENDDLYSDSILQSVYYSFVDYSGSVQIAKLILANLSYLTMGIDNLSGITKTKEGQETVYDRLASVNENRNVSRILAYDKLKEDLSFISQSSTGVHDVIDTLKDAFVAKSDYTYSDLFEETPRQNIGSGVANQLIARMLTANRLKNWVEENWLKNYEKLFRILINENVKVKIPFKVELTYLEQAELEKMGADRVKVLIESGIITNLEARTGYKDNEYTLNLELSETPPKDLKVSSDDSGEANNKPPTPEAKNVDNIDFESVNNQFWDNLAIITQNDLDELARSLVTGKPPINRDFTDEKILKFDEFDILDFNTNLPVYEITTIDNTFFAVNFESEIQAEEYFLQYNPIDTYLNIAEVTPIELNDDGLDCNLDRGCPPDRVIRGAKGRFAGCRPAGGGSAGGGGASGGGVDVPSTINSKTNLAQLRAIAAKEGIATPTKGANKRQTWIDAIESKVGDKYKGKPGRKAGTQTKPKAEKPPEKPKQTPLKGVLGIRKIDKDLESQWIKEHELMKRVVDRNELVRDIDKLEKIIQKKKETGATQGIEFNQERLTSNKKELKKLEEELKTNPYAKAKDIERMENNYGIGYGVATSLGADKIGVYDDKGNLQATAIYSKRGKDDVSDDVKEHVYIDYLATAPWNVIESDKSVKGAGTQAILEAVKLSQKEGYDGRVRLYPIDDAKPFYEKLGFKSTDPTGFFDDWELSPNDAKILLNKTGQK